MKTMLKILVCSILGIMATSCILIDDEGYVNNIPSDAVVSCEPASETHYSAYYTKSNGTRNSTLAPYIYEKEDEEESDVVDAYRVGDFIELNVLPKYVNYYQVDGFSFTEETYRVSLMFDTYIVRYYFVVVLPKLCAEDCMHYVPTFELIDYKTKVLGEEIHGDKDYYCTEATFTLRAYQGEKVFDFTKTVKLRQEMVNVSFDIIIDSGYDGEESTEV